MVKLKLANQPIENSWHFASLGGAREKCVSPYFSSEKTFRKTSKKKQRQTGSVYFVMGFLGDYLCLRRGIPNFSCGFFEWFLKVRPRFHATGLRHASPSGSQKLQGHSLQTTMLLETASKFNRRYRWKYSNGVSLHILRGSSKNHRLKSGDSKGTQDRFQEGIISAPKGNTSQITSSPLGRSSVPFYPPTLWSFSHKIP